MDAIFTFDRQLYIAIVTAVSNNSLLATLAIAVAYLNWNGLIWWISGVLIAYARGWGRRALWSTLTVYLGLCDGWLVAELLKLVVRRERPFTVVLDLPPTLVTEPTTFSFPSGDTAFAFGAASAGAAVRDRRRIRTRRRRCALPARRDRWRAHRHCLGPQRAAGGRAAPAPRTLARVRRAAHALGPGVVRAVRGLSGAARADGVEASRPARAGQRLPLVHLRRAHHRHRGLPRETAGRSLAHRGVGSCRATAHRAVVRARRQPARVRRIAAPEFPGGLTRRCLVRPCDARRIRRGSVRPSGANAPAAAWLRLQHLRLLARSW